jgi:hypothetical protein
MNEFPRVAASTNETEPVVLEVDAVGSGVTSGVASGARVASGVGVTDATGAGVATTVGVGDR